MTNAAANTGARVDTEPSISPTRPGLDDLRHEAAAGFAVLGAAGLARQVLGLDGAGGVLVLDLGGGEVAEQLAYPGIGAAAGGVGVEAAGVHLHLPGHATHGLDPEGTHLPGWAAGDGPVHVLAADQRDTVAEFLDVGVYEHPAVLAFLHRHMGEDAGAVGILVPQALGEVGVDPAVLLLATDDQT